MLLPLLKHWRRRMQKVLIFSRSTRTRDRLGITGCASGWMDIPRVMPFMSNHKRKLRKYMGCLHFEKLIYLSPVKSGLSWVDGFWTLWNVPKFLPGVNFLFPFFSTSDLQMQRRIEKIMVWKNLCPSISFEVVHPLTQTFHRLLDILEACLWQQGWYSSQHFP